jgi:hypothetical protein
MLKNDSTSVRDKIELLDSLKSVRGFLAEVRDRLP